MVKRDHLTKYIYKTVGHDLLEKAAKKDDLPNGVQIHGKEKVKKVVAGVSASPEFISQAVQRDADYLIVHHGLHGAGIVRGRFDIYEDRLRSIFKHNLTLAGFHYALDAHKELGNNTLIIENLGAKMGEPFFDEWGYVAEFSKPQTPYALAEQCAQIFGHDVFTVFTGPDNIKRAGICSGGAKPRGDTFFEMVDKDLDAIITGEINEQGPYAAQEGGYHYFACGHYATETFGIQALAENIKEHYGDKLEVEFLDIPSTL